MQIAIDGPAGAGKSTVASAIAKRLNIIYLDTGAMYRAAALFMTEKGISLEDEHRVEQALPDMHLEIGYQGSFQKIFLCGQDVSEAIRTEEMSAASSKISKLGCVRNFLVEQQRRIAGNADCVLDGRDIGTVVLPQADFKFFLTASPEERAHRRVEQKKKKGENLDFKAVLEDIRARDDQDSHREHSPLKQAEDALLVDSTSLTQEQVIRYMIKVIKAGAKPHVP